MVQEISKEVLGKLHDSMCADFAIFQGNLRSRDDADIERLDQRQKSFEEKLTFEAGRKYIKIITGSSVAGFIVNTHNDSKFEFGTLLKAASWKSPSRNFSRGSIFNSEDVNKVRWTGVQ